MSEGFATSSPPPKDEVHLKRVLAVVNTASGSVGANPADRLREIASRHDLEVEVASVEPSEIMEAIRTAVGSHPDLLILVAGDGTAAAAAELCGMDGPLLAPLPGGTMNMLPHALYGRRTWTEALDAALSQGAPRTISGGEVAGRPFYVAAILGSPALWADAREAIRKRKFRLALLRARRALLKTFSGRLRFTLADGPRQKGAALTLMCPLVSRAMDDETALEAAILDPHGAADAFRLGVNTLLGAWRNDPAVRVQPCVQGRAWAHGRIPVILDGEPHRLDSPVDIRFNRQAFRALVPPQTEETDSTAKRQGEHVGAEAAEGAVAAETTASLR